MRLDTATCRNRMKTDASAIGLDVSFDQKLVDRLIRQAQLPILPSNRPRLLVWVITDDINYGRRFINEPVSQQGLLDDYAPQLMSALDDAMQDRGIPYLLPIYDLEDQISLPVNQAWSLNTDLIASAHSAIKQMDGLLFACIPLQAEKFAALGPMKIWESGS